MSPDVRRVPDLVYGEVPGYRPLELDLYLPHSDGPLPVIVHVHGGGWRRGSRRVPLSALGADFYGRLAAHGFAVAAIDYRLSGEARFPAPLEDVRAAAVPELARQASPVAHASAGAPPILLMHGAADDLVPPAQSVRLAGALRAAGATVELELVPGATHFWDGADDVAGIVRRSVRFLQAIRPEAAAR